MHLKAYFDFGSPYSYLAWQRIRLREATYATIAVDWVAVSAGHIFKMDGTRPNAAYPNQARYMWHDVTRYARMYGVPFSPPASGPGAMPTRSIAAARLHFLAETMGKAAAWREAVFLAYFGDGLDISSMEVLDRLAVQVGLPGADHEAEWKQALTDATQEAYDAGAPGVPFFVLGGGEDVFWGNDRLDWVELRLAKAAGQALGAAGAPSSI